MRNGQNGTIFELLSYHSLDNGIILHINVGCCLVNKYNLTLFEEGPADTQKLLLSSG
jgi:hypothetical protein